MKKYLLVLVIPFLLLSCYQNDNTNAIKMVDERTIEMSFDKSCGCSYTMHIVRLEGHLYYYIDDKRSELKHYINCDLCEKEFEENIESGVKSSLEKLAKVKKINQDY